MENSLGYELHLKKIFTRENLNFFSNYADYMCFSEIKMIAWGFYIIENDYCSR